MNKEKQYNLPADALRIISILAVIIIHTTTRTLEVTKYALLKTPWTLFLNQIARFAVPMFFMISGFVLELSSGSNDGFLTYLKKRLSRILVPFLFWSTIYYFFIYIKGRDPSFLYSLIKGDASYQLYFIPSLLIFYLLFPLIHKYYKYICNKWFMAILLVIEFGLLHTDYSIKPLPLFYPLSIALLNYFVFLFGIVIARNLGEFVIFTKKWKLILFFGTLILGSFVFIEGLTGFLKTHNYAAFYSSWRPSILFYTIFLGGFLYWVFDRNLKFVNFIKTLSKLSFFVFFIHVIILEALWYGVGIKIFKLSLAEQFWYDPLYFLAVAVISFGIAYFAHKIPYLPRLTG